jgi:hypothetical protein
MTGMDINRIRLYLSAIDEGRLRQSATDPQPGDRAEAMSAPQPVIWLVRVARGAPESGRVISPAGQRSRFSLSPHPAGGAALSAFNHQTKQDRRRVNRLTSTDSET